MNGRTNVSRETVAAPPPLATHPEDVRRAVTRRQLLAWGATVGAAATLGGLVAAPRSFAWDSWLRRATYTRRVGESFHASLAGGGTVVLRLSAVEDLAGSAPRGASLAGRDDAFLLEFRGPHAPRLAQGVVELRHRALGRHRFFLVPQALGDDGNTYVVVVNRVAR
jgi:hypothetical protein